MRNGGFFSPELSPFQCLNPGPLFMETPRRIRSPEKPERPLLASIGISVWGAYTSTTGICRVKALRSRIHGIGWCLQKTVTADRARAILLTQLGVSRILPFNLC